MQRNTELKSKICSKCKIEKNIDEFHRQTRTNGTVGRCSRCKECRNEWNRAYIKSHKKEIKDYRNRHQEEIALFQKKWYLQRREEILLQRKEYASHRKKEKSEYDKKYRKENAGKINEKNQRRRALKKNSEVEKVDYKLILENFGYWCYLCEHEIDPKDLHMDHVIPLSRGGSHTHDNIRPTHASCNLSKHDKLLTELKTII